MNYFCCNNERRQLVKNHPEINGIDFLEVMDNPEDPVEIRQTVLRLYLLKPVAAASFDRQHILIKGGERITRIEVVSVAVTEENSGTGEEPGGRELEIKVKTPGDFSTYTLQVIEGGPGGPVVKEGFDTLLSTVLFSFKVLCPSDFDCSSTCNSAPAEEMAPAISYLAKDYRSFRQLMLDRMALLLPDWKEHTIADPGIMLVELLAYVGDYLSYRQDAIATEAYLGTARRRISVRRHARLVDYRMHDGCNARTWIHFDLAEGIFNLELNPAFNGSVTKIISGNDKLPLVSGPDTPLAKDALGNGAAVFELIHKEVLDVRNNRLNFYTWGSSRCSLPAGATAATFDTHLAALKVGQVLIFEEIAGPGTGRPADADPAHRHAVKITKIVMGHDPVGTVDEPGTPWPVTDVFWAAEDALPFDLCIGSVSEEGNLIVVAIAMGNNILADHGDTQIDELLPAVPAGKITLSPPDQECAPCAERERTTLPGRYYPMLRKNNLTMGGSILAARAATAAALMTPDLRRAQPQIVLQTIAGDAVWKPLPDLLGCDGSDKNFVVETESDGYSFLRFGNDINGMAPAAGTRFAATYRAGNGIAGNIGKDVLKHIITEDPALTALHIAAVRNPLAAAGGTEAESVESVKNNAPVAFRTQERAVTAADYEAVLKRLEKKVQKATAVKRWTGSWHSVFLTVDRQGGQLVDAPEEKRIIDLVEKYRMAGEDVEIDNPLFVSMELDITVCVAAEYYRSQVKQAVLNILGNGTNRNGDKGVFHPDNFSFAEPVYLSIIYKTVQAVPGVKSLRVTKFQRQGKPATSGLESGVLKMGRNEIARLNNDPNFREQGVLTLTMQGGK